MHTNWLPLAYLDPGIGSLWIQILIAMVVSTGFFLRTYVGGFFLRLFQRFRGTPVPVQSSQPPQPPDSPA